MRYTGLVMPRVHLLRVEEVGVAEEVAAVAEVHAPLVLLE
jgi:hypothetical protein